MKDDIKELTEAIIAGSYALDCLKKARDEVSSAGSWGIVDLLGGGIISGMVKHSKMNNASESLEEAKDALRSYQDELDDLNDIRNLDISIDSFLTFADFMFDNVFTDWMVQEKITEAKSKLDEAIRRIEKLQVQLKEEKRLLQEQAGQL